MAGRTFTLDPKDAPKLGGTGLVPKDVFQYTNNAQGYCIVSNVVEGWYLVQLNGPQTVTPFMVNVPPYVGLLNATNLLKNASKSPGVQQITSTNNTLIVSPSYGIGAVNLEINGTSTSTLQPNAGTNITALTNFSTVTISAQTDTNVVNALAAVGDAAVSASIRFPASGTNVAMLTNGQVVTISGVTDTNVVNALAAAAAGAGSVTAGFLRTNNSTGTNVTLLSTDPQGNPWSFDGDSFKSLRWSSVIAGLSFGSDSSTNPIITGNGSWHLNQVNSNVPPLVVTGYGNGTNLLEFRILNGGIAAYVDTNGVLHNPGLTLGTAGSTLTESATGGTVFSDTNAPGKKAKIAAGVFTGDGSGLTNLVMSGSAGYSNASDFYLNANPSNYIGSANVAFTNTPNTFYSPQTNKSDAWAGGPLAQIKQNANGNLEMFTTTGHEQRFLMHRPTTNTSTVMGFALDTEYATNSNAYVGSTIDYANTADFWVPIFDGFKQWDLLQVGKGNSKYPGRMAMGGAGLPLTNVQLNIADIDNKINQTLVVYSTSNGITASSASLNSDAMTVERLAVPGLTALAFHQGNGLYDWRVGMSQLGGYDLTFYNEGGTNNSSPSSPGIPVMTLTDNPHRVVANVPFLGDGTYISNVIPSYLPQTFFVARGGYGADQSSNAFTGWEGVQIQVAQTDTMAYLARWSFTGLNAKQHTILVLNASDGSTNGQVLLPKTMTTNTFCWAACNITLQAGVSYWIVTDTASGDGDYIGWQAPIPILDANVTNVGAIYGNSPQGPMIIAATNWVYGPLNYATTRGTVASASVLPSTIAQAGATNLQVIGWSQAAGTWIPMTVSTNSGGSASSSTNANFALFVGDISTNKIPYTGITNAPWDLLSDAVTRSNSLWLSSSNLTWQGTNALATGAFTPSNTAWVNSSNLVFQGTNGLATGAFTSSNSLWLSASNLAKLSLSTADGWFAVSSNGVYVASRNGFAISNLQTGALVGTVAPTSMGTNVYLIAGNANVTIATNYSGGVHSYTISVGTGGTVTSVGLTAPTGFSVGGGPVTTTGTLAITFTTESPNAFLVGPASGGAANPTWRTVVPADLMSADAITNGQTTAALFKAGLMLTNPATGSFLRITNDSILSSNALTGNFFYLTNDSIQITNRLTGKQAVITNGTFYGLGQNLTNSSGAGANGTVTSVSETAPPWFTITGVPITGSGTIAFTNTVGVSPTNFNRGEFWTNINTGASFWLGTNGHITSVDQFGNLLSSGTNWFTYTMTNGTGFGFTNGTFYVNSNLVFSGSMSLAQVTASSIYATNLTGGSLVVSNSLYVGTNVLGPSNVFQVDSIYRTNAFAVNTNGDARVSQTLTANGITNSSVTSADALATDANGKLIAATAITEAHVSGLPADLSQKVLTNDSRSLVLSSATNNLGTDVSATRFWGDGSHLSGVAGGSYVTGAGVALTNSFSSTNNFSHYGLTETNDTTHNWEILTNGGFFTTNAVTGAWTSQTNDSITLSNLQGFYTTITNGALTLTNRTAANTGLRLSSSNLVIATGTVGSNMLYAADGTTPVTALTNGGAWFLNPIIGNISQATNNLTSQSANYSIAAGDFFVLLSGAHTATLPTAVGIPGKAFTILCSSAGTNAILTTSAQTISGATKWTNTAVNKFTTVVSDNANWWVVNQN